MNDILDIMLDVSKLVTGGSDEAQARSRRAAAERERRSVTNREALALNPTVIVAVGSATQPVEKLMGLQSTFAKAVQVMVTVGQWRPSLPRLGLLRLRSR